MTIQEFAPILKVLLDAQQAQIQRAQIMRSEEARETFELRAELVGELIKGVIHAVTKEEAA